MASTSGGILPGEKYRTVTLEILQSCRAAIVIWSPSSIASSWVLDEAQRAMERGVLIPVKLEQIAAYPLGFGQLQAHDLTGWDGDPHHASFAPVLSAVRRLGGAAAAAPAAAKSGGEIEAEVAFWRGVRDSQDSADFEAYLQRYEDGLFADLARRRLEALKRKRAAPKPRAAAPRRRKPPEAESEPAPAGTPDARPRPWLRDKAGPPSPALARPFTNSELAYIAGIVLLAAFLAWPIANRALGVDEAFYPARGNYPGDIGLLFSLDTPQNIFLMSPLLTAFAWGYDRAAAWWAAQQRPPGAPAIAAGAVLALFFFLSLGMRDHNGRETHFALWLASAWIAAISARPAAAWLQARAPELIRAMNRPQQPPSA